jgi:hypothetical protein
MKKMSKFLAILNAVLPLILMFVPGIPPVAAGLIIHAVSTAETIGGAGVEKKAIAMSIIADGINTANVLAKRTVVDSSMIPAVSAVIDSTITTINAIKAVTPPTA